MSVKPCTVTDGKPRISYPAGCLPGAASTRLVSCLHVPFDCLLWMVACKQTKRGGKWFLVFSRNHLCSGYVELRTETKGNPMLYWSVLFLVIALVAAVFGFGGIAAASAGVAQILFVLFAILFAVTLILRLVRGAS